jgi:hypothetical protein
MTPGPAKIISDEAAFDLSPLNDLLRIDGAPICQVLVNKDNGRLWLRFMDTDKHRSQARGTCYIDVPFDIFVAKVSECS